MILPVTLTIGAACAVINIWLAVRIVRGRLSAKILTGDGGDMAMIAGMRAHANFTEYAPIVLILMGLIEVARGPLVALWVIGAVFVAARLAHPIGMAQQKENKLRGAGAVVTWVVTLVLAGWALAIAIDSPGRGVDKVVPLESAPRG